MAGLQACAVHQPNFFPRLSTLAKIFAADIWIVLDDVQFARRDYQQRCRLASLDEPTRWQWLSLPVYLPQGRDTSINEVKLIDIKKSQRRVELLVKHRYGRSPHWSSFRLPFSEVVELLGDVDSMSDVAELSTRILLQLVGWRGKVYRSSEFNPRTGRSERLVDLTRAVAAREYICGSGGARYLDQTPFEQLGVAITYFEAPPPGVRPGTVWFQAKRMSALWALMAFGVERLRSELVTATRSIMAPDTSGGCSGPRS